MSSILKEFYYGNLRSEEVIRLRDSEYRVINQKISDSMGHCKIRRRLCKVSGLVR